MSTLRLCICSFLPVILFSCSPFPEGKSARTGDVISGDTIQYHPVRTDPEGNILPWFSADPGTTYDTVLSLVWNFWKQMPLDSNGVKYYLNHQVWKPEHDMRGLGGDQISMALSSWALYYAYTGDRSLVDDMIYMADYYLEHSLSPPDAAWPGIPYPYNTVIHSGFYDGDMRDGKGITQPDKAGNFGNELITLYKITLDRKYLDAAIKIADCLATHVTPGDSACSPLPFRVNAITGMTGNLLSNNFSGQVAGSACYSANWSGTLMMFEELVGLAVPQREKFFQAFLTILDWMKRYPLQNNRWGPFFEDIPGWSDTQTNAVTFAMFIMQHREYFPGWKEDVNHIFKWAHQELGNREYEKYHVEVMNEQTVYRVPGNSHTSRQSSMELMYASLGGDSTYVENAIRALHWATYTVDHDGKNRYIRDDIWLTDGYGDYVRHFLRAMAAFPGLAPAGEDHLLESTSVVRRIDYSGSRVSLDTYSPAERIIFRLTRKPKGITAAGHKMPEAGPGTGAGWTWEPLERGGILTLYNPGTEGPLEIIWR